MIPELSTVSEMELAVETSTEACSEAFCQPLLTAGVAPSHHDVVDVDCIVSKDTVLQEHEVVEADPSADYSTGAPEAALCVTPADTLALILTHDVVVEITLQKQVRVCRVGVVAATICRGGRVAAVHHPHVEIIQQEGQVLFDLVDGPRVRSFSDAIHVLAVRETPPDTSAFVSAFIDPTFQSAADQSQLLVHTMNAQSVLSHANLNVSADQFRLRRDVDPTVALFLDDIVEQPAMIALTGVLHPSKRDQCIQAAKQAVVMQRGEQISAIVMGVKVKHNLNTGDTRIYCGRNFIALRVESQALTLHSPWVDINVDRWKCTRLRRGDQIIESNESRLVVTQNANKQHFRFSCSHQPIPLARLTKPRFISISDGYDTACSTSKSSESI